MSLRIIDHGDVFHIKWEYDHFHARNLAAVKALGYYTEHAQIGVGCRWVEEKKAFFIPVAKYIAKEKMWTAPGIVRPMIYELQKTHRAEIIDPRKANAEKIGELPPMPDLDIEPPLKEGVVLRGYQRQGVAKGLQLRRFFNCDDQGLGKTIQSITTVLVANKFPCVVVCPPSMKITWQREWHRFTGKKAIILSDKIRSKWPQYVERQGYADVLIVNYQSLKKYFVRAMPDKKNFKSAEIEMHPAVDLFKSIIVDEIHKCKNESTLTSKLTVRLAHRKELRIGLTGTPIPNRPRELYPQLTIIGQQQNFGATKKEFLDRYCEGGSGANNLKELNYKLNRFCFFRREKKDVARDLPEKQRQKIVCEISNMDEYRKAEKDLEDYLALKGFTGGEIDAKLQAEALIRMGVLREISARGKLDAVKEFVDDIIDSKEKIILFCNLHAIVDKLKEIYPKAVTITGRENDKQKQASIDAFMTDPDCLVCICNIKAAGVGLTLTSSWRVAFIEFPWTYADCAQCEDRTHRIGQQFNVMCTYFLGENTIDEWMLDLILSKKDIGNAITGGTDQMEMSEVSKKEMLQMFAKKKAA